MKSLFQFTTDTVVFMLILVLVGGAFLATFALSPISIDDSSVAGEIDLSKSEVIRKQGFIIEPLQNAGQNDLQIRNTGKYSYSIGFSNLPKGVKSFDLYRLQNHTSEPIKLDFEGSFAGSLDSVLEVDILVDDQELVKSPQLQAGLLVMPGEVHKISLSTKTNSNINYPFEVVLKIKKDV